MIPKLEIIDLKQQKQDVCRVMLCQLDSSNFNWDNHYGLNFIRHNEKSNDSVQYFLNVAKQKSIDILVFPELGIQEKSIEKIRQWSEELSTIVICGSQYYNTLEGYFSRCPIIINGTVYFTDKIHPSPLEKSPIYGEGLQEGRTIIKIVNSKFGNIGVLICADYLSDAVKNLVDLNSLDILCVPSFQKQSEIYYRRMTVDCENSSTGIYILYSNFIDKDYGDGKSALFGIMDKLYSQKLKDKGFTDLEPKEKLFTLKNTDTYAVFDINISSKRPYLNKNILTEPNVYFVAKSSVDNVSSLTFTQKIAHDDERYKRIDNYYVKPKEYDEIKASLTENNLIFIIGDPGIGKTYTAVKLLKEYYELGYEPIWFSGLDKEERATQSRTLLDFTPSDKQIIYFEDPFGRTTFEKREALYQVFNPLVDRLAQYDSKIIITSRKDVFEKFSKESLLDSDLTELKKELNVRKPSYSSDKMRAISDKLSAEICDWHPNPLFQSAIYEAIENQKLTTPLSIRDLISSLKSANNIELVEDAIKRRGNEAITVFALEIASLPTSTKVFLYAIFLSGRKGHSEVNRLYHAVLPILNSIGFPNEHVPVFNLEIRSQIGFRVEQYGTLKTFYKFSHPIYEESLAKLATSNYECEIIIKHLMRIIAKENAIDAYRIINSIVVKYPDLSLSLFVSLLDEHEINDEQLKVLLCQKLVSIYYINKNITFFNLSLKVYPLNVLVNSINESAHLDYLFTQKLNLAKRIRNFSPIGFDSSDIKTINWEKVFANKTLDSNKHMIILLNNCNDIDAKSIHFFINNFNFPIIKRLYLLSGENDRIRLQKLFKGTSITRKLEKLDNQIRSLNLDTSHASLRVKDLLFSEYIYYGKLEIDEGAFRAIKRYINNLLPVGILKVTGVFDAGTIVGVYYNKQLVAVGMSEYSSYDLNIIKGYSSQDFPQLLNSFHTASAIQRSSMLHLFNKKYAKVIEKWKDRIRLS